MGLRWAGVVVVVVAVAAVRVWWLALPRSGPGMAGCDDGSGGSVMVRPVIDGGARVAVNVIVLEPRLVGVVGVFA